MNHLRLLCKILERFEATSPSDRECYSIDKGFRVDEKGADLISWFGTTRRNLRSAGYDRASRIMDYVSWSQANLVARLQTTEYYLLAEPRIVVVPFNTWEMPTARIELTAGVVPACTWYEWVGVDSVEGFFAAQEHRGYWLVYPKGKSTGAISLKPATYKLCSILRRARSFGEFCRIYFRNSGIADVDELAQRKMASFVSNALQRGLVTVRHEAAEIYDEYYSEGQFTA